MIPREMSLPDGRTHTYWDYDPDYAPPMPAGAVRGDIRRQVYCCDTPHYFYVDVERRCIQCGRDFTFGAREQKYWYESLQFLLASTAVRCVACRRRRRSRKALAQALEQAVVSLRTAPDDSQALLRLAEATVAHATRLGSGDLDRAIAAARKVSRRHPEVAEALYWQARCHDLAGRPAKADEIRRAFLDLARPMGRLRRMVRAAEKRLARTPRTSS